MSQCRSCHAEIEWACVEGSVRLIPLDAEPDPEGNILILRVGYSRMRGPTEETLVVRFLDRNEPPVPQDRRRHSHFATCPDADEWRKR